MNYRDYLLMYVGHIRSYFLDYAKFRSVAYQEYLSQPKAKGEKAVSLQKYMYLPFVDDGKDKAMSVEQHRAAIERFKAKLQNGK